MKKYILILILLISCGRSQSKTILNNEDINIAKIDSTEIDHKTILQPTSSKKQNVLKDGDTLNIPSKYTIAIPLEINKRKIDISLQLSKSERLLRGKNYTVAEIENTDNVLPKSAYECIEGTIELQDWQTINNKSYSYTYDYYKKKNFKENDFVTKKKMIFRNENYNFITITDMDNDGYEDLLILDLSSSMKDNDMYQFYKWSGKESKFIFVPDFFNKAAFYGWDKTGKYLITGVSDTKERKLYKNKVVGGQLKIVDQCTEYAVSDKLCW
ncbi:hypothetical protein ACM40_03745 [Chryseobacterium sp. BLS98]|uniref:hypothetical protein n=1 Tax=Chryseobacterium sp. BLS98 TaxID=885586 RepID=UPI00065B039F|nr:hypothetical protein [Chryseobacterium sp. BLS98]KMQ63895.1 hypothetical protein ACM40_03745 [Chryseobacterium sp. BLS98]